MKKYIGIIAAAFLAYACADNDYETAFQDYVGINTAGLNDFPENGGPLKIPVIFGGEASNSSAFNVTYEVTGGTYGVDYTIDGGNGATGTVAFPAGSLSENGTQYIVIRGVPDFDIEDNVPLSISLKSSDREMRVGYPYHTGFSFVITDDDCPFEFEGELVGDDASLDLGSVNNAADVTITKNSETEYVFDGISIAMMTGWWNEKITDYVPTVVSIVPGGAITIEEQYIYTTDYLDSKYGIRGTGQVNYCDATVSLTYEIYYISGGDGSFATVNGAANELGWMSGDMFTATLKFPDED